MPPKSVNKIAQSIKKEKKAIVKAIVKHPNALSRVKGHGDYRPTSANRVRGRGDYLTDKASEIAGGLASQAVQKGSSWLKSIFGFGDYRTKGPKKNSLFAMASRGMTDTNSAMGNAGAMQMGAMNLQFDGKPPRFQHREFIGPLFAPAAPLAFNTTEYRIQPGIKGVGSLMPWCGTVADSFQKYTLHGMIVQYVRDSSDFASGSALGTVMMSTVYNAEAGPLMNEVAVKNNEHTTCAVPSQSFIHPVECAPRSMTSDSLFVHTSNAVQANSTDLRLDDVGIFQISTSGLSCAAGTQFGELWVTYDIEFFLPVLPDQREGTSWEARGALSATGTAVQYNAASANVLNPGNSLPATIDAYNAGALTVQMPSGYNGNYVAILNYSYVFAGMTLTAPSITVSYGTDILPILLFPGNGAAYQNSQIQNFGTANVCLMQAFSTTAENPLQNKITFVPGGTKTTAIGGVWSLLIIPTDNDVDNVSLTATEKQALEYDKLKAEILDALRAQGSLTSRPLLSLAEESDEKQPDSPTALDCAASSESRPTTCSTPELCGAEDELEKSIHLSAAAMRALLAAQDPRQKG